MYLGNRFGIKRNKINVTILILIIIGFVFVICQVYMVYYTKDVNYPVVLFNVTLNKTIFSVVKMANCVQANSNIVFAQDMIFVIMRIIIPFIIMVICNVFLVKHISKTRKAVIRGREKKRENSFTMTVSIMNGCYLICNIGVVLYYFIFYYLVFSGSSLQSPSFFRFSLYGTCSILLSYIFILSQFFIDMIFNKVFRKEIYSLISFLTRFRYPVKSAVTSRCNTQETNL